MTTTDTMTLTAADVGTLVVGDEAVPPSADVIVPPQTLDFDTLKPGQTVFFVDHTLNTHPACHVEAPHETNASALAGKLCMVIAVEPEKASVGKAVAVCFKEPINYGHSCDGRVPHGHGAYVRPGHLYTPEAYAAHQVASVHVALEQKRIDEMLKGFVTSPSEVTKTP
jgi:hypothetical protein